MWLRCYTSAHWAGGQGTLKCCSLHCCFCSSHAPWLIILVAFFRVRLWCFLFRHTCLSSPDPFIYSLNQTCSFLCREHFCMLSSPPPLVTAEFAGVPLCNSLKIQSHIPCYCARMSVQTAVFPFSTKSFLLLAFVDYHVCEFAVGCDCIFLPSFLPLSPAQ